MARRWTLKELREQSTKALIVGILSERRATTTNAYSPLNEEIHKLMIWAEKNLPDTREHDRT